MTDKAPNQAEIAAQAKEIGKVKELLHRGEKERKNAAFWEEEEI